MYTIAKATVEDIPEIRTIYADVEEMNKKSIEFYKKHGFRKFDTSEEKIGDIKLKVIELVKRK